MDKDVGCVMVGYDQYCTYNKIFKAINYLERDPECLFIVTKGLFQTKNC